MGLKPHLRNPLGTLWTVQLPIRRDQSRPTAERIFSTDRGQRAKPQQERAPGQAAEPQPMGRTSSASLCEENPTYQPGQTKLCFPLFSLAVNSPAAPSVRDQVPWQ